MKAARFIYLNRTCFNGIYRVNLDGEFNVPKGTKSAVLFDDDDLDKVSKALSMAQIHVSDFEALAGEDLWRCFPPVTNSIPVRRARMPKGKPSGKQTVGLLRRRHVRVERIIYIGKESNRLEEIRVGVIHSPESVYTEYPDPRRDEWQTRILPVLKKIPIAALMRLSDKSRSMLVKTLAGRSRPRRRNLELLKSISPQTWGGLVSERTVRCSRGSLKKMICSEAKGNLAH